MAKPRAPTQFQIGVSGNPGGRALPERLAQRTIQEAFRALADPVELGRELLEVWRGVDPTGAIAKPADNMPSNMPTPVDWPHRLAALKMFLEYSYGKPVQGHTVQAQIEATQRIQVEHTHTTELRELAASDPALRELMRAIAAKMAGTQPPPAIAAPSSAPVIDIGGVSISLDDDEESDEDE